MNRGTVRWFSDETGEGCILPDEGSEDLLVCVTGVAPLQGGAFEVIRQYARVTYELVVCETGLAGRERAKARLGSRRGDRLPCV
jgi:cold shock CspA family protein